MGNNVCIRTKIDTKKIDNCKVIINKFDTSFNRLSYILSLAGNSVRLKILYLLSNENSLCVCDLSDILKMNISAISQHLRKLKDKDVVIPERKGQTVFYSVNAKYKNLFSMFFEQIKNNAFK